MFKYKQVLYLFKILPGSHETVKMTIDLDVDLSSLAEILEAMMKCKVFPARLGKIFPQIKAHYGMLTPKERENIRSQILKAKIPASGCTVMLDPLKEKVTCTESGLCTSRVKIKPLVFNSKENTARMWILETFKLHRLHTRHKFVDNIDDQLSSSKVTCVVLLEEEHNSYNLTKIEEDKRLKRDPFSLLVVAKLARDETGKKKLAQEARALKALQQTRRVPVLWNPQHVDRCLQEGALLASYHPNLHHSTCFLCMSLPEIEELAIELLKAVQCIHAAGWLLNGIRPGHILFNQMKSDPRDPTVPLRFTGLENAFEIEKMQISIDSQWMETAGQTYSYSGCTFEECAAWTAPESKKGFKNATLASDIFSVGLVLNTCLHRSACPVYVPPQNEHRQDVVAAFNKMVHDARKRLNLEHWIWNLISSLLVSNPSMRPTAENALQNLCRRQALLDCVHNNLVLGTVNESPISGFMDSSGRFIWPVIVTAKVIVDPRNKSRNTLSVNLKSAVHTPEGSVVCRYSGRPCCKEVIMWLALLGCDTHGLSDGALGGWDGRRLANGIFDIFYYIGTERVSQNYYRYVS